MNKDTKEGIIIFDKKGKITVCDPFAKLMMGFVPRERVTARNLDDKIRGLKISEAIEECKKRGRTITERFAVPYGDGKVLQCGIFPVRDAKNTASGMLIVLRDIPKDKEVDKMKAEFISTVSHELRTPLSITKEGISLVLDEIPGEINREQNKILTMAKNNVDRLAHLINNLLDIARIDAGKTEIDRKSFGLKKIVEDVISSFESRMKQKQLRIKTVFPGKEVKVYADREKIRQVFGNLIENAVKFVEEGYIEISIIEKKDVIECSVKDTGAGFSKDQITRAFDRFQQFGRVEGAGEKGTGIGLAIAKEIVEMHHGRMWVESRAGEGAKFLFTLPKYTPEQVFKEHVNIAVEEALFWDSKMALIAVVLKNIDRAGKRLSANKTHSILNGIKSVLKGTLLRKDNGVFQRSDRVVMVLADCSEHQITLMKKKFKQALKNYLAREKLADKITVQIVYAMYPEDGRTAEELIRKIEEGTVLKKRRSRKLQRTGVRRNS